MAEEVKFILNADDNASRKLDKLAGTLKAIGGVVAGVFAIDKIIDFGKAALASASEAEQIAVQLGNAVKNSNALGKNFVKSKESINSLTNELLDYSGVLQKQSTFDDESIALAQTKLVQAGLTVASTKTLTKSLLDRVAATESVENQDAALVQISEVMGKALNGNMGILAKYNVHLTEQEEKQLELMNVQDRAAFISDKLAKSYGGAASALRESNAGAVKAMTEEWSNFQQAIGTFLAPIVTDILKFGLQIINTIQGFMATLTKAWDEDWGGIHTAVDNAWTFINETVIPKVQKLVDDIKTRLQPMIDWLTEHWDTIMAIYGFAFDTIKLTFFNFWEAMKLILTVAWELFAGIIKFGLSVLMGDWRGAWSAIKEMFIGIWNAMGTYLKGIISNWLTYLGTSWGQVGTDISIMRDVVTGIWNGFWNGLKAVVEEVVNFVSEKVQWVIDKISAGIKLVNEFIEKAKQIPGVGAAVKVGSLLTRASGGPLGAGQTSVVGERGPELFTPKTSGNIIPNNKLGGSATTVVFNFNGVVSSKEVAMEYADLALRQFKLSTQVI